MDPANPATPTLHPYIASKPSSASLQKAQSAGQKPADFGPGEKIVKAWYAKQITTDQMVRYGYESLFTPTQVPANLRPTVPIGEQAAEYLAFLAGQSVNASADTRTWAKTYADALKAPATAAPKKSAVSATGNKADATAAATAPQDGTGDPGCSETPLWSYPVVSGVSLHDYYCEVDSPHFMVLYNHADGLPEAPDANGVPTEITTIDQAAEEAYAIYTDGNTPSDGRVGSLHFPSPGPGLIPIFMGDILHATGAVPDGIAATLPGGPTDMPSIWMPADVDNYDSLVRHELFHAFQYQFLPTFADDYASILFRDNFASENWWMEASAQWATGETYRLDPEYAYDLNWPITVDKRWIFTRPDGSTYTADSNRPADFYTKDLLDFLGTGEDNTVTVAEPHRAINTWTGLDGSRPYGVFPLAEYLSELSLEAGATDLTAVLHTWELVGQGLYPLAAITQVLSNGYGYGLDQAWLNFAVANYRLGAPSALSTSSQLQPADYPPDGYTAPDVPALWSMILSGRPALDAATPGAVGAVVTDTVAGLQAGGQSYTEFDAVQVTGTVPAGTGRAFSVTIDPVKYPNVTWELVAWQQRLPGGGAPTPTMVAKSFGTTGTATVVIPGTSDAVGSAPYVTLIMTRTDFDSDSITATENNLDVAYQHVWSTVNGLTVDGVATTVKTAAATVPTFFAFACTAGQVLYANGSTTDTGFNTNYTLFDPSGAILQSSYQGGTSARKNVLDFREVATTGTCMVRVDPPDASGATLVLQMFGSYLTAAATVDGAPVSVTIPTASTGKRAKFTFTGKAGQTIYIMGNVTGGFDTFDALIDPVGKTIATPYQGGVTTRQTLVRPVKLTAAGTYTLQLQPPPADSGKLTVQVLGSFVGGTVTVGGAALSATIPTTAPGKWAKFTFTGKAGQTITITGTVTGGFDTFDTLYDPTGKSIATSYQGGVTKSQTLLPATVLPAAGTYTFQLEPPPGDTGLISVKVS